MGELPEARLSPAPPLFSSVVYLFGLIVKDTMKCRTQKEVYGVVRECLVSRTVYLDFEEGYYKKNGALENRVSSWIS